MRAKRRKAQERKVRIQKTVLFLALIGILVGVLLFIGSLGKKKSDNAVKDASAKAESTEALSGTVSAAESAETSEETAAQAASA